LETENRLCDILQEADFLEERALEQLFAAS
jgi:hypothetical protein